MVFQKKTKNFIALIYIFFIFSLFISLFLNLNEARKKISNSSFIQIELVSKINSQDLEKLEKKILELKEVKKVRYYSKEESLKNLIKELEISISEASNPLSDIIIVNVSDLENAKIITEKLEVEKNISTIHIDENFIMNNEQKLKIIKMEIVATIFLMLVPIIILIVKLYSDMVENNYIYYYLTSKKRNDLKKKAKRISAIPIAISAIIGTLSYVNFYYIFRNRLKVYDFNFSLVSSEQVILVTGSLSFLVVLVCWLRPFEKKEVD
ncbi:MAG: cell division protein FtsX [Fusobacteriaceae bacterium]